MTKQEYCLNAPQGFMLIPTWILASTTCLLFTVLMPLRASCSFQRDSFYDIKPALIERS